MASVKVAVRCRPLNKREEALGSSVIISMQGRKTFITNVKAPLEASGGDSGRERAKTFAFDFSYWSADKNDSHCINEDTVFADLGIGVIDAAIEGYNACVFAYGQTGSGKTHTMMGSQESPDVVGLTPRICQGLYNKIEMLKGEGISFRTEVSYLEIYNERVRDLLCTLGTGEEFGTHSLRVREHPKEGPYVQDLSKHLVMNYADIQDLMNIGNNRRTTAATQMNDTSSRSHAIFTITFSQARFSRDMPSEMVSKVHLVDLAGSERADASGATGVRLKEGGSINKSLVTLGTVIHALADMCSVRSPEKKQMFVPYRNSVLTWLLKDSLGGNSKTIMIATISPADVNYAETLSTLRYANRAKNIINKPTVNEDPNVRLIRDLRSEIAKLRAMLGGNVNMYPGVHERLHESEARVKVLTEEWQGRWQEMREILTEPSLGLRREGLGVVLDSELPHLIAIDDDLLSTGVILYHLKEGKTKLGMEGAATRQDIYLSGLEVEPEHCVIMHDSDGVVTLIPQSGAQCVISGTLVEEATQLSQGCVILLGQSNMFRFNHPAEAASLRRQGLRSTSLGMSRTSLLSQSMSDLVKSTENLTLQNASIELEMKHQQELEQLEVKRKLIEELERCHLDAEESRRDEQEMRDREMAEQSLIIERIHQETARLNKEAEEAQDRIKREELKLHRKSMDIEQQRKEWMEEVERFQVEKERLKQEKEKMEEEFEQRELDRQEVEEKRSKLEQQQKLLFEQENEGKSPIGSVVNTAAQVALDDDECAVQARVKLLLDQVLQQDHGDDADADSLSESGSDGSRICQLEERIQSQEEQLEALVSNEQDSRSECNREERAQLRQAILQQLETGKTELLHILQSKGKRSKVKRLNSLRSKEERLESKIEELKELAHQYTNTMDELEDKRDKFERERMLELDKIETEKLQLQEMEDQERINALVEAEVKRRCFDETVRRAKALKRSRERERRTREQEMSRLKRAHEIEIQRLKQQLVSRTADAGTALPTKANPYATIHNSDSLTSLRRPSADVVAGGNDLPLRVAVPAFVLRGHGADAHYEYEVQVALRGESWVVYRRYSRFRELRQRMTAAYPVTAGIPFPPKRWFRNRSEWVVAQRREQLEGYLRRLVEVCGAAPGCPLNVADGCVVKHSLWEFSSFFKKGVFETTKHGTG